MVMVTDMDTALATTDVVGTANVQLMQMLLPMLMLLPIMEDITAMVVMALVMAAMVVMALAMALVITADGTVKDLLMLSPLPMLMPSPLPMPMLMPMLTHITE